MILHTECAELWEARRTKDFRRFALPIILIILREKLLSSGKFVIPCGATNPLQKARYRQHLQGERANLPRK